MMGTRVLSNPPGATAFCYLVLHAFPPEIDPPRGLERMLVERSGIAPENVIFVSDSLKAAAALVLVWTLAAVSSLFLGRLLLSSAGAFVFAILVSFNPCTVHFVPGKDPAQLLTINLMLLAWLAAWKNRKPALAIFAGALLLIGSTVGLIHIWVALAAWSAVLWHNRREPRLVMSLTAAAAVGAIAVAAIAFLAIGWNIPLQLFLVWRRFNELQATFNMNRAIWFIIGLPSFLAFLSPGFWALVGLGAHERRFGFGARLALCTAAMMLLTYLLGITYELPRLWVAFLPPLTLALSMDLPLLRSPRCHRKVTAAFMLIVTVQIVFTAMHWTIFDVRESEYRLATERFYH
jgi:hypothetical protein